MNPLIQNLKPPSPSNPKVVHRSSAQSLKPGLQTLNLALNPELGSAGMWKPSDVSSANRLKGETPIPVRKRTDLRAGFLVVGVQGPGRVKGGADFRVAKSCPCWHQGRGDVARNSNCLKAEHPSRTHPSTSGFDSPCLHPAPKTRLLLTPQHGTPQSHHLSLGTFSYRTSLFIYLHMQACELGYSCSSQNRGFEAWAVTRLDRQHKAISSLETEEFGDLGTGGTGLQ